MGKLAKSSLTIGLSHQITYPRFESRAFSVNWLYASIIGFDQSEHKRAVFQPIRSKLKTKLLLTRVFPRLAPVACVASSSD